MKRSECRNYLVVFGLSLLIATLFFLPFLIYDRGIFVYYGDYNAQQIPFYKMAHEAIQSGQFGWNWQTDLGANFIGSYSFYLIGNPFFWLTIPFPNAWVPYLMAPLMILKLSCAAVTGYAFIRRFTKTSNFAVLGALLYAFSGFNIYNIFFNHFLEITVFFPLLLIALEEFVLEKRRVVFALTVFLCAIVNYYFFIAEAIFTALYFFIRLSAKEFRSCINLKVFLMLALEAVLGFLCSAILFLPSVMAILGNYRVDQHVNGYNLILYDKVQRYGLILESIFFPPDMPAHPNFFPESASKWGSVSAYLPLFSLSGVVAYFKSKKPRWVRFLLAACALIALVPGLNQAFQLFNYQYYARWFFMPILIMALATSVALEDPDADFGYGVRVTGIVMASFALIGILPKDVDGTYVWFQLPKNVLQFWAYVVFAAAGLFISWLFWKFFRRERQYAFRLIAVTSVMIILLSAFLLALYKGDGKTQLKVIDYGVNGAQNLNLEEEESGFYRIDIYEDLDNYGMYWGIPSMRSFHSIVPTSIIEFYKSLGLDRGVASRAPINHIAMRSLLSVKYIFVDPDKDKPSLSGFRFLSSQNGRDVYENANFIPMGFTYDFFMKQDDYESYSQTFKDRLLLRAIVLDEEQAERYGDLLKEITRKDYPGSSSEDLAMDCADRRDTAGFEFEYDSYHFTSRIQLDRDNLVFYSVPYDEGWTATVNGDPVKVENVSHGMMAVRAPAGENVITFTYETPGLKIGCMISLAGFALLIVYGAGIAAARMLRKRKSDSTEEEKN